MTTKQEEKARARRLQRMAIGESGIRERLLEMRADIDQIGRDLDRLTLVTRRPRIQADLGGLLPGLDNIFSFHGRRRR